MSLSQQGMFIMLGLFIVLIVPVIIYSIYVLAIRNKKYSDVVEAEVVRFEKKFSKLNMEYMLVPVYKYIYNYQTYEVESKYLKFDKLYNYECDHMVKLKINPDDPYDILDNRKEFKVKFREWTKLDTVMLICCIITAIITAIIVFKIA